MVNADQIALDLEHHLFADYMIGDLIPVAAIGKLAVLVNLAENLQGCVIVYRRVTLQAGDLLRPSLIDRVTVRAMNPAVGCVIKPGNNVLVGFLNGVEVISPPEALTNIMDGPLHFALHPWAIGRGNLGQKTIMMGEVEKLDVKSRFAILSADNHIFHVIVQNLCRNALKITKRIDMTIHKNIQCAALYKLHVHGPGITENHYKGINSVCLPIRVLNLEITPVNLGLESRFCLKANIGQLSLLFFDITDITFYRIVAAKISDPFDSIGNPGCLVVILVKVVVDDLLIWFQNAY